MEPSRQPCAMVAGGRPFLFFFCVGDDAVFAMVVDALIMAEVRRHLGCRRLFHTIRSRVYGSGWDNTGPRAGSSGFWGVLSMKSLETQERPTNTYLPPRRKSA